MALFFVEAHFMQGPRYGTVRSSLLMRERLTGMCFASGCFCAQCNVINSWAWQLKESRDE
ncbi:hypothetical protein CPA57_08115 [Bombella sp. TMW2.1880]|uniref:Uncharacterized protein n=2 Tax=Bombella TaxID=1654741 RepID=A0A1S8GP43_9PROT|nr:hypothetical protein [Bombella favorum]OOL17860.1 hypothetical protein AL01_07835 [Bombella intestini]